MISPRPLLTRASLSRASAVTVAALALAACGAPATPSVDEGGIETVTDSPSPTASPDQNVSPTAEPATTASLSGTDQDGATSPGTLAPPADFDPECVQIYSDEPGADIKFPDSDVHTHDAGAGPAEVTVVGCSNTFEASVMYEFIHGTDAEPTIEGFTMGGAYGDWNEFTFTETLWTPGGWTVLVLEQDAATGERVVYDEVFVTVD